MEAFVMPPLALLWLTAVGLLLRRRRKRLGNVLAIGAPVVLVLLCVPLVSASLLISLQSEPALTPERLDPKTGAIVVLGGDVNPYAPEYGGPTVGPLTLERVRYAAELARQTHLPVMTSGGVVQRDAPALAEIMKRSLERDFGVEVRWTEKTSANTEGNAICSAAILREAKISRVYLVTHAWHMPRAKASFESEHVEVVPAPTAFRAWPAFRLASFLPSARSLRESQWALHEWIGRVWYAMPRWIRPNSS
jgi:uncharacterized SAM-binding protein YcdF (DUF218 family)